MSDTQNEVERARTLAQAVEDARKELNRCAVAHNKSRDALNMAEEAYQSAQNALAPYLTSNTLLDLLRMAQASRVDRTQVTLVDGSPVTPDHRDVDPGTGLQKAYVVLSEEERAKGFVRPVRRSYVHTLCGATTTMAEALAETYAREPGFYSGTYCTHCRAHYPVGAEGEFVWAGSNEKVGT